LKEPFTVSCSGKQVRDVLHAEAMKKLYFAAVEHVDTTRGQAFNIGGGMENSLSLLEFFEIMERELDVKLNYLRLPPRNSDQKVFVADINKAQKLTGWKPQVSKAEGIRKMIEWVSHVE